MSANEQEAEKKYLKVKVINSRLWKTTKSFQTFIQEFVTTGTHLLEYESWKLYENLWMQAFRNVTSEIHAF